MNKTYLQITSGRGPIECCRVVTEITNLLTKDAQEFGYNVDIIECEVGPKTGTHYSIVISIEPHSMQEKIVAHNIENFQDFKDKLGNFCNIAFSPETCLDVFLQSWEGTVQWISESPYRPYYKRKNWFVGVKKLHLANTDLLKLSDNVKWEVCRASGPGGQHVNRTESAVKLIHIPTGISVIAQDKSSQSQNKALAMERLKLRLAVITEKVELETEQKNWQNHNELQRGNPIRIFKRKLMI